MKWRAYTSLGETTKHVTWDEYCEVQHILQVWAEGGLLLWELEKLGRLDAALKSYGVSCSAIDAAAAAASE